MKNLKITIGAITLICALLLGITIQMKAAEFFKNLCGGYSFSLKTPKPAENHDNVIQLALLLDTSGSMNGLLEQAKSQLWKIVNELTTFKRDGEIPALEIALYEFGTAARSNANNGWIRQISNFTTDMDQISEELFALSTNGSAEFCGLTIQNALNDLQWTTDENNLRMIYIAGNESFAQGPVDFRTVAEIAKERNIFVNTIFCGNQQEGIQMQWQAGAVLAGGDFASIDHNQATVYVETPFDKEISNLNEQLNQTYMSYGKKGQAGFLNLQRQDSNANGYSLSNSVERTVFKSKKNYSNASWDLIDASKDDKSILAKNEQMPEELVDLTFEERVEIIDKKTTQRAEIQQQIQNLNQKRKQHIAAQSTANDNQSLENSILKSVHKQAAQRGLVADNTAEIESENKIPKIEEKSSLVDYNAFQELTKKIEPYRQKRLVSWEKFQKMSKKENTIILDTRSTAAYKVKHLKGAIHLNFSDFTAEKLAKVIPSKDTRILIYCNNNFLGDPMRFASKAGPLALNIPTFINLYGYGYENIYELKPLLPVNLAGLEFEGEDVLVKNNIISK